MEYPLLEQGLLLLCQWIKALVHLYRLWYKQANEIAVKAYIPLQ